MALDFTMPKLGLTMTDGTIREWLVPDGTSVKAGDPVLVIETDKVETEVEAREDGVLTISGVVGENYECGAVIGQLLGDGESATPAAAPAAAAPAAAQAAPAPVQTAPAPAAAPVAAAGGGTAVATAVAVRGEHDRILASPMARAAARDGRVDLAGIAGSGPGGRIVAEDVAGFLAQGGANGSNGAAAGVAVAAVATAVAVRGEHDRILASPMARAAARDGGVDLAGIAGSGPDGRIVADDVAAFIANPPAAAPPAAAAVAAQSTATATAPAAAPAPAVPTGASAVAATAGGRMLAELLGIDLRVIAQPASGRLTREDVAAWVRSRLAEGSVEAGGGAAPAAEPQAMPLLQEPSSTIPLRGMRGVIAERMHASLQEMAQLTLSVDADMTAINAERTRLKDQGVTAPGYTAWVIAAASRALVEHPYVNSQVTEDGVCLLPDVHVGVAVALDDGLIVPVVHNTSTRPVADVHESVADLAGRARDGKLAFDELQGGTFSVTALGMYGVDMFTPVINPPNTAILGVGRLRTDTKWTDGVPSPVTVMTLSLTWDHRAFDGAPAAEFAQSIVRHLENPSQLSG